MSGVTVAILVAGVLIGVDQEVRGTPTDQAAKNDGKIPGANGPNPAWSDDQIQTMTDANSILFLMDWTVNIIFTIEVLLRPHAPRRSSPPETRRR